MSTDIFLTITNNINGETIDDEMKKKNAIDILSYSWGVTQQGTFHSSGGAGGGAGRSDVQNLHMQKYICKASPELMQACATGRHLDGAVLYVRKAGDKPLTYFKLEMTKVMVSSYQTGSGGNSGGGALITESFSLNFEEVKFTYVAQDPKTGGASGTVSKVYNAATNKGS